MSSTAPAAAGTDISAAAYLAQTIHSHVPGWWMTDDEPEVWVFTEPGRPSRRSVTVDGRNPTDQAAVTVTAVSYGVTVQVQYPPGTEHWLLRALRFGLEFMAVLPPKEYHR